MTIHREETVAGVALLRCVLVKWNVSAVSAVKRFAKYPSPSLIWPFEMPWTAHSLLFVFCWFYFFYFSCKIKHDSAVCRGDSWCQLRLGHLFRSSATLKCLFNFAVSKRRTDFHYCVTAFTQLGNSLHHFRFAWTIDERCEKLSPKTRRWFMWNGSEILSQLHRSPWDSPK